MKKVYTVEVKTENGQTLLSYPIRLGTQTVADRLVFEVQTVCGLFDDDTSEGATPMTQEQRYQQLTAHLDWWP